MDYSKYVNQIHPKKKIKCKKKKKEKKTGLDLIITYIYIYKTHNEDGLPFKNPLFS